MAKYLTRSDNLLYNGRSIYYRLRGIVVSKAIFLAKDFCLVTFVSTHHALRAERILEEHGFENFIIVPTPRDISSSCGLSIKFFCSEKDLLKKIFQVKGISIDDIYEFKKDDRGEKK